MGEKEILLVSHSVTCQELKIKSTMLFRNPWNLGSSDADMSNILARFSCIRTHLWPSTLDVPHR